MIASRWPYPSGLDDLDDVYYDGFCPRRLDDDRYDDLFDEDRDYRGDDGVEWPDHHNLWGYDQTPNEVFDDREYELYLNGLDTRDWLADSDDFRTSPEALEAPDVYSYAASSEVPSWADWASAKHLDGKARRVNRRRQTTRWHRRARRNLALQAARLEPDTAWSDHWADCLDSDPASQTRRKCAKSPHPVVTRRPKSPKKM